MLFPMAIHLALILATTSLVAAYPTWYLAIYQFRCKPPSIVEVKSDDWTEWKVSSICAPGTCCSTSADTGPLCTAEACDSAAQDRERLLRTYNYLESARKKTGEENQAKEANNPDKLKWEQEMETKWKMIDAMAEADREKALAETQAQV
ncbi:hypothetical protein VSDG_03922 [Cytospora chrysosperma]|uniref:Uncharacterized protein n=1 Tax=Cytospora chrysosperma TaxID=252740 RepID=A0A423W7D0_CYTCH|nr:hypothetical protein VSDG_03922 [Valsa sordida]